jgi:hypothetical protein
MVAEPGQPATLLCGVPVDSCTSLDYSVVIDVIAVNVNVIQTLP